MKPLPPRVASPPGHHHPGAVKHRFTDQPQTPSDLRILIFLDSRDIRYKKGIKGDCFLIFDSIKKVGIQGKCDV
ncbi:hypothetical protein L1887_33276 [Cichorium endivia]|nr:hypothetical protein L1887_33276 [Cichorium endivia]